MLFRSDHAVGRFLRDRGYRLIQLPSWFVPTARSAIADEVLTPSIGSDFDRLLHDTTILALWDDLFVPPIGHDDAQHRDFARFQLRMLERLRTAPHAEPRFVFAHILLPHPPYVFDETGAYPGDAERLDPDPIRYARQMRWTEAQVEALVGRILDVPEAERPIPFGHMLYLGDGLTDVPCMTVTKNYGGFAIAVHNPGHAASLETCRALAAAERIDYFAEADYRRGRKLEKRVHSILDLIIARIQLERGKHAFRAEMAAADASEPRKR